MTIEKGRASAGEITLLLVVFILGTSILLAPASGAVPENWLAILLGMGEAGGFIFIFWALLHRFPGKTLVEIAVEVYGVLLGKFIAALFLLYLIQLGSLVGRNYGDYIKMNILLATPMPVILFAGMILCAYGAWHGLEVLARCSQGIFIITIIFFGLVSILLLPQSRMERLFPLFAVPVKKLLWAAHGTAIFPFGESVVFLMILPYINEKKKTGKVLLQGLALSGFFLTAVAARNIAILGKSVKIFLYPTYQAARLINIAHIFTRMEILVASVFMMIAFMKFSVLLYGSALGVAQLCRLQDYRSLVIPIGALMILLSIIDFANVIESIEFAEKIYPIYSLLFIVIIPLFTLIIAYLRKIPQKEM